MKILLTGASGFVGSYMIRELLRAKHDLAITSPVPFTFAEGSVSLKASVCDLCDLAATQKMVQETKADAVIHMAGFSHVKKGADQRLELINANVLATNNLTSALWQTKKNVNMLFISSTMVYPAASGQDRAVNESTPLGPISPYGWSKLSAEAIVQSYESEHFHGFIARPGNHTGPGQSRDFVCAALANRIATTPEKGTIPVGNLDSRRAFTDVRDIVRAYRLIIEKAPQERVFVLGADHSTSIGEIFEMLCRHSGKNLKTYQDPTLVREADKACVVADSTRAKNVLGWNIEFSLDQTLREIYEYEKG